MCLKVRCEVLDISHYADLVSLWQSCSLPYKPEGRDSKESMEKEMSGERSRFIGAFLEGKMIGTILATHDGRKGWINRLAVLQEFRRKGVGGTLVHDAERWLDGEGIGIFACLIEGFNSTSFEVFERLGYSEFEGVKYFTKRTRPDI